MLSISEGNAGQMMGHFQLFKYYVVVFHMVNCPGNAEQFQGKIQLKSAS